MSSHIEAINQRVEGMAELFAELNRITSGTTITKQQEARAAALQSQISALKSGLTPTELAEAHMHSLRKELGISEHDLRNFKSWNGRNDKEYRESVFAFLTGRDEDVRSEYRPRPEFDTERRTNFQNTSEWGNVAGASYAGSGYFVPADYDKRLFASLASIDGIADAENCNVVETIRGAAMTTPAVDDVSLNNSSPITGLPIASVRIDQSVSSNVQNVRTDSVQWGACPTYRSGIVYCAVELEQDSAFAMMALLDAVFARRHALGYGAECINGSGVQENTSGVSSVPYGLLTAITANSGTIPHVTASNPVLYGGSLVNYPNSLLIQDLQRLWKALPKQYRSKQDAKFYMSSGTAFVVAQTLSNIYKGVSDYFGLDKLFGHDIVLCDSMPDMSDPASPAVAVSNAIVFANSKYLLARHVKNASYIRRFTQSTNAIEAGLTGFESFFRADFRPMLFDSIQPPVAVMNFPV
jgi:HK97 family phage major capsid protein